MAKRTRLKDIADLAGVGIATVDRVLNARAPVSFNTAKRVLLAAERLDYHYRTLLNQRIEELAPDQKFGLILQKRDKWVYQTLAKLVQNEIHDLFKVRGTLTVQFVDELAPDDLAANILSLKDAVQVLAVVSIDHPLVSKAIEASCNNGVRVVSLLSRLNVDGLSGHVGIDAIRAGRTAGWFVNLISGCSTVGILIGSHRYLVHEERVKGFESYIRINAPQIQLREPISYLDTDAGAYEAAADLLRKVPELTAIYHCGGGVVGVCRALAEAEKAGDTFYICNENSPQAQSGLRDGTVDVIISSPLEVIAQRVSKVMKDALVGKQSPDSFSPVDFQIITTENC